jgi:hypothetical protein
MGLNINQLTACTTLQHWFPVTARSQQTSAEVILALLAEGTPMTCEELTHKGKAQRIGCFSHVGTTLSQLWKQNKVYRVDGRRPFKYALSGK